MSSRMPKGVQNVTLCQAVSWHITVSGEAMPITCTSCGTQLPDEANFCLHCGQRLRRDTHIVALASQRGCVGKTTTAINLSACLAEIGYQTLVVDIDPLSDATRGLGVDSHKVGLSAYELLVNENVLPAQVVKSHIRPNLSLLPAKVDLYAADTELAHLDQREFRLKRALDAIKQDYDFILIDCPSWLGIFTINALTAADGVILPLQCEHLILEGVQQLLNTIRLVRDRLNPKSLLFGVVLTMYDPHTKLGSEVVREISEHFPKEKFNTVIARDHRLAEALRSGLTILEHDPGSPGALCYKQLAQEVITRAAIPGETYS
jgi:chromosome partitioning protein